MCWNPQKSGPKKSSALSTQRRSKAKPFDPLTSAARRIFSPKCAIHWRDIQCMYEPDTIHIHVFSYILLHIYDKICVDDPHVSNDITIDDENQTDPWEFNRPSHRKIWRTPPTVHWKSWGLWDYNGWMAKKIKAHIYLIINNKNPMNVVNPMP